MPIGAIISQARKRKGWNQTYVAKQMGMKLSTYAKKESDGGFSEEQLKQLAKCLQVKLSELQNAKANGKIVIDDAMKLLVDKSIINEVYLTVILDGMASLIADIRGKKKEVVLSQMLAQVEDGLAKRVAKG